MLQPFELFKVNYIDRLLKLKKPYLVTQTYTRQFDKFSRDVRINILVTDYEERVMAKTHWDALKHDRYRAILDLKQKEHKSKLIEMLSAESKYRIFWAVVKSVWELERCINETYPAHMKRYIEQNTTWRIGRDKTIRPSLQLIFGELFIILKYSGQTLRVKFEDIENV